MVLVDAIFINNGGGKVLLDYLITELERSDLTIHYLLHERIINDNYTVKSRNRITYLDSGMKSRYCFYKKNESFIHKAFVLGNIPPPIRIEAYVITYFHNLILLKVPKEFGLIERLKFLLKFWVIQVTKKNTNLWLVQSDSMKTRFTNKLQVQSEVSVLPFFPTIYSELNMKKEKGTFIYVSNAQDNKNHIRLISAFCKSFDQLRIGKLLVTVSDKFPEILTLIAEAVSKGYPVVNLGFIHRDDLATYYLQSEYVIYPSLSESFGLGLIEGASLGCKIVGAHLPYTFAVCEPSCTFDPSDEKSIQDAIVFSLSNQLKETQLKVKNEINQLITLLS